MPPFGVENVNVVQIAMVLMSAIHDLYIGIQVYIRIQGRILFGFL